MEEEIKELSLAEEISYGRYEVVSKTYSNEFKKCTLLIFDSSTGEVKKKEFNLY